MKAKVKSAPSRTKGRSAKTAARVGGQRRAPGTRAAGRTSAKRTKSGKTSAPLAAAKGRRPKDAGAAAVIERPAVGDAAPDFLLEAGGGDRLGLSDFTGTKSVVLYFYPKDMTSGCTAEACAFRDAYGKFRSLGAEILGVSMDPASMHKKFADKHSLPFPLLADQEGEVSRAYGVYKEKSMYGRKFWGIERSTFVIDRSGRVRAAWRKVKVNGHDEDVLKALVAVSRV